MQQHVKKGEIKYGNIGLLPSSKIPYVRTKLLVGTRVGSRWKLKDCLALDCRYVWDSGC